MTRRCLISLLLLPLTLSNPLQQQINITTAEKQIFIPMIQNTKTQLGMGIAWQQVTGSGNALNADWQYYDYHNRGANVLGSWKNPDWIEECEPTMLIFNEPDLGYDPNEVRFTPQEAAQKSRDAMERCPSTVFIAGNVSQFGRTWLQEYVSLGGAGAWLGFHCYVWEGAPAQMCIDTILEFKNAFPGHNLCLTEWNVVVHSPILLSDLYQFGSLLQYIQSTMSCSAVFTDYWYSDPSGKLNLLGADKTPNEIGTIYANRNN